MKGIKKVRKVKKTPLTKGSWSPSRRRKMAKNCSNPRGFTMKNFCKNLKTRSKSGERTNRLQSPRPHRRTPGPGGKEYLYNPKNPKKSFDVYIDKNPDDTISIKYSTPEETTRTVRKLERLYKEGKYTHKRIKQVAVIMDVRLQAMKGKKKEKSIAKKYHQFLQRRTKEKSQEGRKKMKFQL